mgnify:CR=1 FL=1
MQWRFISKDWLQVSHKSDLHGIVEHHCLNIKHIVRVTWGEDANGKYVAVRMDNDDAILLSEDEFPSQAEWSAIISLRDDTQSGDSTYEPSAKVTFIATSKIHCPFCGVAHVVVPWHYAPKDRECWLRLVKENDETACQHVIHEWFYIGQDLTKEKMEEMMKTLRLTVVFTP